MFYGAPLINKAYFKISIMDHVHNMFWKHGIHSHELIHALKSLKSFFLNSKENVPFQYWITWMLLSSTHRILWFYRYFEILDERAYQMRIQILFNSLLRECHIPFSWTPIEIKSDSERIQKIHEAPFDANNAAWLDRPTHCDKV